MKRIILLFALLLFSSQLSFAQTDSGSYKLTLEEMLQVSGAEESFKASIDQMIAMYKQQKPEVPAELWELFGNEFKKDVSKDLMAMLLPIYQKHLTENELKDIIIFYRSPAGKKLAQKNPLIVQESMQAGQQWGMKIGQEFANKLKEKGF
ncbi:DUF2059 domain-containing protein [Pedobacter sp. AW31-3R]|uniref:DUF2059 domain-containing protein n=1 Tax=Pedobacter sp. AW31-3R TaxID=3445781 RepID=UPI003FA0287B